MEDNNVRLEKYAKWLRENKDKKDTPEFQKVANAYRQLRIPTMKQPVKEEQPIKGEQGGKQEVSISDSDYVSQNIIGQMGTGKPFMPNVEAARKGIEEILSYEPFDVGEEKAQSVGEFFTKAGKRLLNLPVNIAQFLGGLPYRTLIKPAFEDDNESYFVNVGDAVLGEAVGLADFFSAPVGGKDFFDSILRGESVEEAWDKFNWAESAKSAYLTDPLATVLPLLAPATKGVAKAKGAVKSGTKVSRIENLKNSVYEGIKGDKPKVSRRIPLIERAETALKEGADLNAVELRVKNANELLKKAEEKLDNAKTKNEKMNAEVEVKGAEQVANDMVYREANYNVVDFALSAKELVKKPLLTLVEPASEGKKARYKYAGEVDRIEYKQIMPDERLTVEAAKVEKMFEDSREAANKLRAKNKESFRNQAARAIVDASANVKRELLNKAGGLGREAVMRHELIKGSNPKAALLNKEASGKIYKGLSPGEIKLLDKMILAIRDLTIKSYKPDYKLPRKVTTEGYQQNLLAIPEALREKLKPRAQEYFNTMKEQLNQLRDNGLVSSELYDKLKDLPYSPKEFINHIDPYTKILTRHDEVSVPSSGIKYLDEGSYALLETNSQLLLNEVITRTQARIAKNKANQALFNIATELPKNGVVSLAKVKSVKKNGEIKYEMPPEGQAYLDVMIDGNPRKISMPIELTKEWARNDPLIASNLANFLGWASGTKILKAFATGYNPGFALTNMPRDIAHAWLTTKEYSTFLPKAFLQLGHDYAVTAKDAIFRGERARDYIKEGGGMSFMTHQGQFGERTKMGGKVKAMQDVFGYIGETSEVWTRLALRERALRNGKRQLESVQKRYDNAKGVKEKKQILPELIEAQRKATPEYATWIARRYIDFSLGGSYTKAADTVIPYIGAGIQGTRGIFRAGKESPATLMFKFGQLGTIATLIYMHNQYLHPGAIDELSEGVQDNNFNIYTGLEYIDSKDGRKKKLWISLPKDQGQRAITGIFERIVESHVKGEPLNLGRTAKNLLSFFPMMPTDAVPPVLDVVAAWAWNLDTWSGRPIYYDTTSPTYQQMIDEEMANSPILQQVQQMFGDETAVRAQSTLESLFTKNNMYSTVFGEAIKELLDGIRKTDGDEVANEIQQSLAEQLVDKFGGRIIKNSDELNKAYREHQYLEQKHNEEQHEKAKTFNRLLIEYNNNPTKENLDKTLDYIVKQDVFSAVKDIRKLENFILDSTIPESERSFWLMIAADPPKLAADVLWSRVESAIEDKEKARKLKVPDKEQTLKIIEYMIPRVRGIASPEFFYYWMQYKKKYGLD